MLEKFGRRSSCGSPSLSPAWPFGLVQPETHLSCLELKIDLSVIQLQTSLTLNHWQRGKSRRFDWSCKTTKNARLCNFSMAGRMRPVAAGSKSQDLQL